MDLRWGEEGIVGGGREACVDGGPTAASFNPGPMTYYRNIPHLLPKCASLHLSPAGAQLRRHPCLDIRGGGSANCRRHCRGDATRRGRHAPATAPAASSASAPVPAGCC